MRSERVAVDRSAVAAQGDTIANHAALHIHEPGHFSCEALGYGMKVRTLCLVLTSLFQSPPSEEPVEADRISDSMGGDAYRVRQSARLADSYNSSGSLSTLPPWCLLVSSATAMAASTFWI